MSIEQQSESTIICIHMSPSPGTPLLPPSCLFVFLMIALLSGVR